MVAASAVSWGPRHLASFTDIKGYKSRGLIKPVSEWYLSLWNLNCPNFVACWTHLSSRCSYQDSPRHESLPVFAWVRAFDYIFGYLCIEAAFLSQVLIIYLFPANSGRTSGSLPVGLQLQMREEIVVMRSLHEDLALPQTMYIQEQVNQGLQTGRRNLAGWHPSDTRSPHPTQKNAISRLPVTQHEALYLSVDCFSLPWSATGNEAMIKRLITFKFWTVIC